MYVSDLDVDWSETHFLFKGFLLANEEQLSELKKHCAWVLVSRSLSNPEVINHQLIDTQTGSQKTSPEKTAEPRISVHLVDSHAHQKLKVVESPVSPARFNPIGTLFDVFGAASSEISQFFTTVATRRRLKENYNPMKLRQHDHKEMKVDMARAMKAKSIRNQFKSNEVVSDVFQNHIVSKTLLEETKQATALQYELLKVTVATLEADLNGSDLNASVDIAKDAISEVVESVSRNPDAMQLVSKIKVLDDYSYQHALQVCLLMIAFGRELCLSKKDLVEVGLGGLLHDVGEIKPPDNVSAIKRIRFITKFKIYKDHVGEGLEIAKKSGYSNIVQAIIENHHEHYDGTGYPKGTSKSQLGLYGNMIIIVDHYVSLISGRNCEKPLPPNLAIAWMHRKSGTLFNPQMLDQFTQVIGVYPVGAQVLLSTGDIGFVIKQNKERRLKPVVMVVMDKNKNKLGNPIHLDLMAMSETKDQINVKRELPLNAYELSLEDYI